MSDLPAQMRKTIKQKQICKENILSIGNFLIQRFRVFPYLWSRDKSVGGVGAFVNRRDVFEGSWRGAVVWSLFVFQSPETEDGK